MEDTLREVLIKGYPFYGDVPKATIVKAAMTELIVDVLEWLAKEGFHLSDQEKDITVMGVCDIFIFYVSCLLYEPYENVANTLSHFDISYCSDNTTLKEIYRGLYPKKVITYSYALLNAPSEVLKNTLPQIPPLLAPIPTDIEKAGFVWVFVEDHPNLLRIIPHILLQCTPLNYPDVGFVMYIYHVYDVVREKVEIVITYIPCDMHGWCGDRPRWHNGMPLTHYTPFRLYLKYLEYLKSVEEAVK